MTRRRLLEWSSLAPLLVLAVGVTAYVLVYTVWYTHLPIDADGQGYYAYLPAYLLDHDGSFNSVLARDILPTYYGVGHQPPLIFGFTVQAGGNWLDKYSVGVAMLDIPFFALGHGLARAVGAQADGYSVMEQHVAALASLLYTIAGLYLMRALLRRWFSDIVVAVTLVTVTLGSGVIAYLSWEPLFSHDFTFFAVSAMLLCSVRWFEQPRSWGRIVLLGLVMGLVVAIRLTNVVLLLMVPLMAVGTRSAMRARLRLLWTYRGRVAVAAVCALLMLVPQMLTWYVATGHLITRPYSGEPFFFLHPHLLESLIWLRPHGILPYYPVLGLGLVGLLLCWFRRRDIALPVTVGFVAFWYISSAWWDWSFTSAFGDRAYVDVTPILMLPTAALFAALSRAWMRRSAYVAAAVLAGVTSVLFLAYAEGRMPQDGTDASGYVQALRHPRLTGLPRTSTHGPPSAIASEREQSPDSVGRLELLALRT